MPLYRYSACNPDGTEWHDAIEASSAAGAVEQLRRSGFVRVHLIDWPVDIGIDDGKVALTLGQLLAAACVAISAVACVFQLVLSLALGQLWLTLYWFVGGAIALTFWVALFVAFGRIKQLPPVLRRQSSTIRELRWEVGSLRQQLRPADDEPDVLELE
jgi:hypothetical protein